MGGRASLNRYVNKTHHFQINTSRDIWVGRYIGGNNKGEVTVDNLLNFKSIY